MMPQKHGAIVDGTTDVILSFQGPYVSNFHDVVVRRSIEQQGDQSDIDALEGGLRVMAELVSNIKRHDADVKPQLMRVSLERDGAEGCVVEVASLTKAKDAAKVRSYVDNLAALSDNEREDLAFDVWENREGKESGLGYFDIMMYARRRDGRPMVYVDSNPYFLSDSGLVEMIVKVHV